MTRCNCTVSETNLANYSESVECDEGNQMVGNTPSGTSYDFEMSPDDVYVCTFTNRPVQHASPTPTRTPTPTPSPTPTRTPSPGGAQETLVCTASNTTPTVGSQVTITCVAKDAFGNPEVSTFVTLAISSQPGNDAQIGSIVERKVTDSNGVATGTLKVGSTPGMIVMDNSIAFAASRVTIFVQGTAATPQVTVIGASSTGGSGPPTSYITPNNGGSTSSISPPNTGDAGLASSGRYGSVWLAALAFAVSSVAAGLVLRRRLQQR